MLQPNLTYDLTSDFETKNLSRRSSYGRFSYIYRKPLRSSTTFVDMAQLSDDSKVLKKWTAQIWLKSGSNPAHGSAQ